MIALRTLSDLKRGNVHAVAWGRETLVVGSALLAQVSDGRARLQALIDEGGSLLWRDHGAWQPCWHGTGRGSAQSAGEQHFVWARRCNRGTTAGACGTSYVEVEIGQFAVRLRWCEPRAE